LLLLATAWLHRRFGGAGALAAATVVALAEVHAAGATIGQLFHRGELPLSEARWGVVLILAASALAKSVLAFLAGGRSYGWRVAAGLLGMVLAAAAVQVFRQDWKPTLNPADAGVYFPSTPLSSKEVISVHSSGVP
jgi:uncharacterized membrane protein (DUF4010 family)